jgi:hypothetical protein
MMFYGAESFNQNLSGWYIELIPQPGPTDFDTDADDWALPRPNWGATCP